MSSIIPKYFWEDVRLTLALLNSHGSIFSKFLLRFFAEVWMSCITEDKEASSGKSFALDETSSVRSII